MNPNDTDADLLVRFNAFDTWFFRESRPMESIGGSELTSLFPPPMSTLAGALRTAIGEHLGVDWAALPHGPDELHRLARDLIGTEALGEGVHPGQLRLAGPWLARRQEDSFERIYPAPANLMTAMRNERVDSVHRLCLGPPLHCDLGKAVRMPVTPNGRRDLSPASGYWLGESAMRRLLAGATPDASDLIPEHTLYRREPRLGIARHNQSRTVQPGLLYQTLHLRPEWRHSELAVEVELNGASAEQVPSEGVIRLGGEGRAARFVRTAPTHRASLDAAITEQDAAGARGLVLLLLTPLAIEEGAGPVPLPGFAQIPAIGDSAYDRWVGDIEGIGLSIEGALLPRSIRLGGWDLRSRTPRPVRSLLPAGALFYARLTEGGGTPQLLDAIATLNRSALGPPADRALGRGRLAAGLWPGDESIGEREEK